MFEEKEAALKAYIAEVRRLKALLAEWRARLEAECDMEALEKLKAEIKEWKRRRKQWELRTEEINGQADEADERIRKLIERIEKEKRTSGELKEKLAGFPNINPNALKMKRLEREI